MFENGSSRHRQQAWVGVQPKVDFSLRGAEQVLQERRAQIRVHPVLELGCNVCNLSCRELDRNMVVGGYRLPKGTPLIFSAYLLHHGPYNYTRAEDFWPERFEAAPCTASADPREPIGMMYLLTAFVSLFEFKLLTDMNLSPEVAVQ